jgi:uncharacterized membrane protein
MLNERLLARGLGVLSLVLGAVYLVFPRRFTEWLGVRPTPTRTAVVAAVGVREIVGGVGLLANRHPVFWLVARVLGDIKDLALLGAAMRFRDTDRRRVATAAAGIAGITALDALAAAGTRIGQRSAEKGAPAGVIRVEKSVTVRRPADEVYGYWRDFQNLPRFMANVESVEVLDDRRSHWKARAPLGRSVEWTAEITDDRPGEEIAWRSLPDAAVTNAGRVRFTPAPRDEGTEIHVEMEYSPPAGALGAAIARLGQEEPNQQVAGDLRRFKQVMETGEVVVSESTYGDGGIKQRPAQPPAEVEAGGAR